MEVDQSDLELTDIAGQDLVGDRPAVSVGVPVPALLQRHAEVLGDVLRQVGQHRLLQVDEGGLLAGVGAGLHHRPALSTGQFLQTNPGDGVLIIYTDSEK